MPCVKVVWEGCCTPRPEQFMGGRREKKKGKGEERRKEKQKEKEEEKKGNEKGSLVSTGFPTL